MRSDAPVMLGVFIAAIFVRAAAQIGTDFPLNDGGLFLAMARELELHGWGLPASVPWNGVDVPFAYPPIGLYLTGGLTSLGVDFETLMRVFPLIASAAAAALVLGIGRRLLDSRPGSIAAALTYAFAPAAFTWSIAGGGVTRAPGMALALGTIWLLLTLLARPTSARAVLVGIAGGATILTHPASAAFAAGSAAILILASLSSAGSRGPILRSASLAAGVAFVVVLPWAWLVISQHGFGVLVDVPSNGPDLFNAMITLVAGRVTGLGTDPLGLLVIGIALISIAQRRLLLPAWLLGASLLGVQYAIVPASLLIGSLIADALRWAGSDDLARRVVGRVAIGVVGVLLVTEAGIGTAVSRLEASHLHPLGADRREAMRWIASNTPGEATVAVLTGDHWSTDPDSEWFYVLAERSSVATVQGSEWLGRDAFGRAETRYAQLQRCTNSLPCLDAWLRDQPAAYLFIPKGRRHGPDSPTECCAGIRVEATRDRRYQIVYDGPGATILRTPTAAGGD